MVLWFCLKSRTAWKMKESPSVAERERASGQEWEAVMVREGMHREAVQCASVVTRSSGLFIGLSLS